MQPIILTVSQGWGCGDLYWLVHNSPKMLGSAVLQIFEHKQGKYYEYYNNNTTSP